MGCFAHHTYYPERDIGKYGNSNVRGLESLFMFFFSVAKKKQKKKTKKNIRHKSGNSHVVGTDKAMMPPIEIIKC